MCRDLPIRRLLLVALLGSVAAASGMATSAMASEPAVVSRFGGTGVSLRHADTSAPPRVQTLLAVGDRLTVGEGSFVEVEYLADRCTIRVNAGSSIVIAETSPCSAAAAQAAPAEVSGSARDVQAAAAAVEVTETRGPVTRVNKGNGLVDTTVGESLAAGDEVYAGPSSAVTITFTPPNCRYTVEASTLYKVKAEAPCKAGATAENGKTSVVAGTAVAATAATAVAIGALVSVNNDDDNDRKNPATPD